MSSKYQVPNVDRALTMLELLRDNPKGMTATEMANELGFSQTSVFRISMTLLDRGFPAGSHSVVWDGRDSGGQRMPSGAYFIRLEAGPHTETQRVMMLK